MAISSPVTSNLKQILKDNRYEVPMYQRPFSWTVDTASMLWADMERNNPPYFLGILVFQDTGDDKTYKVVDGQQRLATLLLLIRAAVAVYGKDSKLGADLHQSYINQKDWGDEEPEFTLQLSEWDKLGFKTILNIENVTHLPERVRTYRPDTFLKKVPSLANLTKVKEYFEGELNILKDKEGEEGITRFIQKRVLSLQFIVIKLEDDNDVFQFFETLNGRGVDLTVADLLKNMVCMISNDKNLAASKIDEITDTIGEGKLNNFLFHYCFALSIRPNPPTKKDLMTWYRDTIELEREDFLNKLKDYTDIYAFLIDPRKAKTPVVRNVLNYIKALGATRCYPLLLVAYKFLSPTEFIQVCKAVESLTFRHSTITGQDAKTLEDVYYKLSKKIQRKDRQVSDIIEELNKQGRKISNDKFTTSFNEFTPGNNLVARYTLLKIEHYLNKDSADLDWDDLTLEHILVKGGAEWEGKEVYLGRLGNMTLLKDKLNKSVGNKDFETKKEEYKKESRIQLTSELVSYTEFTKDTIIERQKRFSILASKVWNSDN